MRTFKTEAACRLRRTEFFERKPYDPCLFTGIFNILKDSNMHWLEKIRVIEEVTYLDLLEQWSLENGCVASYSRIVCYENVLVGHRLHFFATFQHSI